MKKLFIVLLSCLMMITFPAKVKADEPEVAFTLSLEKMDPSRYENYENAKIRIESVYPIHYKLFNSTNGTTVEDICYEAVPSYESDGYFNYRFEFDLCGKGYDSIEVYGSKAYCGYSYSYGDFKVSAENVSSFTQNIYLLKDNELINTTNINGMTDIITYNNDVNYGDYDNLTFVYSYLDSNPSNNRKLRIANHYYNGEWTQSGYMLDSLWYKTNDYTIELEGLMPGKIYKYLAHYSSPYYDYDTWQSYEYKELFFIADSEGKADLEFELCDISHYSGSYESNYKAYKYIEFLNLDNDSKVKITRDANYWLYSDIKNYFSDDSYNTNLSSLDYYYSPDYSVYSDPGKSASYEFNIEKDSTVIFQNMSHMNSNDNHIYFYVDDDPILKDVSYELYSNGSYYYETIPGELLAGPIKADSDGRVDFGKFTNYGYRGYVIKIIGAPNGYFEKDLINLSTSGEHLYKTTQNGDLYIPKGPISAPVTIEKIGKKLVSLGTEMYREFVKRIIKTEDTGLQYVRFGVYSSEDIYHEEKLLYKANELIEEIETDDYGIVQTKNLVPGKYYLREISTDYNHIGDYYTLYNFEVKADSSDDTAKVYINGLENNKFTIYNQFKNVNVTVNKTEKGNSNIKVAGAEYGLFAANNNYDVPFKVNELLATAVTDANGKATFNVSIPSSYNYYIKEISAPEGYKINDEKKTFYPGYYSSFSFNVTDEAVASVNVTKVWDDANDRDGLRPDTISISLLANGNIKETVELDQSFYDTDVNKWNYKFDNLPKYDASNNLINYTVVENDSITGYSTDITHTDNNWTITNKHEAETVSVYGTKTWDDGIEGNHRPSAGITIRLHADGVPILSTNLSSADGQSYSFDNLPKYWDGHLVDYTVTEDAIYIDPIYGEKPLGYIPTITVDPDNTYHRDILNTHHCQLISIPVEKVWDDNFDEDGIRPDSVTIHLLQNGIDTGKTLVLNESNLWHDSFDDLDYYTDSTHAEHYTYTVVEEPADEYTTTYEGNQTTGFVVKNSYTPLKTDVTVNKVWIDQNNEYSTRPEYIVVRLLENGHPVAHHNLTEDEGWTYKFENLPLKKNGANVTYSIEEDLIPGYTTDINDFTITNTLETVTIEGAKTWDHKGESAYANPEANRPSEITVTLKNDFSGLKNVEQKVTAADNWTYKFENMPKYYNGELVDYTIEELHIDNYMASYDGYNIKNTYKAETVDIQGIKTWDDNGILGHRPETITLRLHANGEVVKTVNVSSDDDQLFEFLDLPKYDEFGEVIDYTVSEDEVLGYEPYYHKDVYNPYFFEIHNFHDCEKVSVTVSKEWVDKDDLESARPEKVYVYLLQDGTYTGKHLELSAQNDWEDKFTHLDYYKDGPHTENNVHHYTVVEGNVKNYDSTVTGTQKVGYVLVNTYNPEKTDIKVSKVWSDLDNHYSKRPESVTVRLFANEKEVASVKLSEENNWNYTFGNLTTFASGADVTYTVKEDKVDGYISNLSGNPAEGYIFTNTYVIPNNDSTPAVKPVLKPSPSTGVK